MKFHGPHPENLVKTKDLGLTVDVLPEELGGTLPHGDVLAKVSVCFNKIFYLGRRSCAFY